MLKYIWLINNILLIVLILIRVPNAQGLQSINSYAEFLGSPKSISKNLDIIMGSLIFIFLFLGGFLSKIN